MTMITFETPDVRFTYRVAGIAIHDEHVLLEYTQRYNFWFVPGGRCELLEQATTTLQREMQEELGIQVYIQRLLWIVENFFFHCGKAGHELAFYFLMTLPLEPWLHVRGVSFRQHYEDEVQILQWFRLNELDHITLYPTFLKEHILSLPTTCEHMVHTDEASTEMLHTLRSMP